MNDPLALSFGLQLDNLMSTIRAGWAPSSPEAGFAAHVLSTSKQVTSDTMGAESLPSLVQAAELDRAPNLAVTGYAFPVAQTPWSSERAAAWSNGFNRLSQRDVFPLDRNSFVYRPVELLGVALGAATCPALNETDLEWLRGVLVKAGKEINDSDCWAKWLWACAASVLSCKCDLPRKIDVGKLDAAALALLFWISTAYPLAGRQAALDKRTDEIGQALLRQCAVSSPVPQDLARCAVLYVGLKAAVERGVESAIDRNWQVGRQSKDAVAVVQQICDRFHLVAIQLRSRSRDRDPFKIEDEYDVQDLMHALLKLHFDDVRAEEYTPSYAGSSSKLDFILKREKVVIETKMPSRKLDQKKVASQLIDDKERYKAHPDCQTLVCFVYDPDLICENAASLENDLAEDTADRRVIVIVRPRGT